jgi:hypothetical protein
MVSTMGKMIINQINLTVSTVLISIEMKPHPQSQQDSITSQKNPFPPSSSFPLLFSLSLFDAKK